MTRSILIFMLLFATFNSFSQDVIQKRPTIESNYSENSAIKIVYTDSLNALHSKNKPIGIFVNGSFINENVFSTINPDKIEKLRVEKESFEKDGKKYFGKILVDLKSDYKPSFIFIKSLITKHLNLDSNPIIFQIDENIINQDYSKYLVDENYILKIELTKIETSEKNNKINLIKLITKTPENIDKANEIRIK